MVSAMRFSIMSPPLVNDVARFLSLSVVPVGPSTLPAVIGPVGLAAITLGIVAMKGAPSAAVLLQDVGLVGVTPVSTVRIRSFQSLIRFWSARLILRPWYHPSSPLHRSSTLCPRATR